MINRIKLWARLAWTALVIGGPLGCADASATAAAASYGAALDQCVAQGDSGPAIDACRHAVDVQWGVADAATDANGGAITVVVSSKEAGQ